MRRKPTPIGPRIRRMRERLGSVRRPLSLADTTELLNEELTACGLDDRVSTSSLERWEKDRGIPPRGVLLVMSILAGMSFEDFVLGEPPAPKE